MGSIAFLQPWFLLGELSVIIPLAIHLINRQRRRRVEFSAVRFLLQTDRRSARKYRLVDLIALLLRMLLLGLIALALAQPVLRPPGADSVSFGRVSLAVVLDDTVSMRRGTDGVSAFDRARDAVATVLSNMPQDGEARVLLVSGRNPASLSMAASPPSLIADAISDLEPSFSARPLAETMNRALEHLEGSKPRHKSLLVVTDNQISTLRNLESVRNERFDKFVVSTQWIDVGEASANMAVIDTQASPATCFAGTPVRIVARVRNASEGQLLTHASLWVDGMKISDTAVECAALSTNNVVFEHLPQLSGMKKIEVRIESDAMGVDNSRFAQLRVLETVRALIIVPDGAEGALDAAYLKTALNPLASPNYSGKSPVLVSVEPYNMARHSALASYDLVFVIDANNLSWNMRGTLRQYMDQGGAAVFFPSRSWLQSGGDPGILGEVKVGGLSSRQPGEAPVGFGSYDASHPVFALLSRSAPQLFGLVTVDSYARVSELSLDPYAQVAARLTTGDPLLIDQRMNKGRCLVWTVCPHPDWTDLPLRPLFLPLLYETLKFASDAASAKRNTVMIDQGLTLEMAAQTGDARYTIESPDGSRDLATLEAGETVLQYEEALKPGHYSVYPVNNMRQGRIVSVNIDPSESVPGRISTEDLTAIFDKEKFFPVISGEKATERLHYASQGINMTGFLLGLALAVFLTESFISNSFLRRGESAISDNRQRVRRLFHRVRAIDPGN